MTGVQTCALPILQRSRCAIRRARRGVRRGRVRSGAATLRRAPARGLARRGRSGPTLILLAFASYGQIANRRLAGCLTFSGRAAAGRRGRQQGLRCALGQGFHEGGEIADIKVNDASGEDAAYYNNALSMIDAMIEKQTHDVPTVSGATYSSNGLKNAVKQALRKAAK